MNKIHKNSLISVVVPVYNVERYLNKCVDSIINQTYKNLEIILVDDGSFDSCPKICDEYAKKDKRIKVVHKKNGGLSDARNFGIEIAKGEYITFVDSDDYIEKEYVEILYNAITKDKTDMAIGVHTVIYDNGTKLLKETNEKSILEPKVVLERILYDDGIDLTANVKLYKKSLFKSIRFPKGRLYEDAATTYKLVDICDKISFISVSIYNYIIRMNSITNSSFSTKKLDLIISTKEMCDYIVNKYPELKGACNRRLMWAYLSTLSQLAMCDKRYINEEKELISFIRKNSYSVLKDKRAPMRDKIGILSSLFGFKVYQFMWNIYRRITGRK